MSIIVSTGYTVPMMGRCVRRWTYTLICSRVLNQPAVVCDVEMSYLGRNVGIGVI